jgi:hypothetical protein
VVNQGDNDNNNGKMLTLTSPIDHIPLHIRGGFIIPTQEAANNTVFSRLNPFGLIVAPESYGEAKGDLFYDDGETDLSIGQYFYATLFLRESVLRMNVEKNNYTEMKSKVLNKIRIFVPSNPNTKINFLINKSQFISDENIVYEENQIILNNLNLPMSESFEIEWTTEPIFLPNSNGPIIDCGLDNKQITDTECLNKGCLFFDFSGNEFVPKCFVPQTKGGYILESSPNPSQFNLNRGDKTLNLVNEPIENVIVTVSHGLINSKYGLTRIKVVLKLNFNS